MTRAQEAIAAHLRALARDRCWADVESILENNSEIDSDFASLLTAELSEYGGGWLGAALRRGAKLDAVNRDGVNALGACILGAQNRYPTLGLFAELLSSGASPRSMARDGNTALQMAIEENKPEYAIVLLLLDKQNVGFAEYCQDAQDTAQKFRREWAKDVLRRWSNGNTVHLAFRPSL